MRIKLFYRNIDTYHLYWFYNKKYLNKLNGQAQKVYGRKGSLILSKIHKHICFAKRFYK